MMTRMEIVKKIVKETYRWDHINDFPKLFESFGSVAALVHTLELKADPGCPKAIYTELGLPIKVVGQAVFVEDWWLIQNGMSELLADNARGDWMNE